MSIEANPFDDLKSSSAFDVMYNECVNVCTEISGSSFVQSLKVAVFQDASIDPFTDQALDTDVESIQIISRPEDLAIVKQLKRGDVIERPEVNGQKYKVTTSDVDSLMGHIIKARSI